MRRDAATGVMLDGPRPAPYGHNRYEVYAGDRRLGSVTGGGAGGPGSSRWWEWQAVPREGEVFGKSGRYCNTRTEAIERLVAEHVAAVRGATS